MKNYFLAFLISTIIIISLNADEFKWDKTEHSIALKKGDQLIWKHNHNKAEGKPYFHPLSTIDGTVLTWLRPKDHV